MRQRSCHFPCPTLPPPPHPASVITFRRILVGSLLAPAALHAQARQEAKGNGTVVLRAARLIDGTGAAAINNGIVVVTEDKIVAAGASGSVSIPPGARV